MRRFLNLFKNKPKAQSFHLVRAVGLVVRLLWEQKRTAEREDPHALLRPHGECGFPTKSGKTKFCKVPPKTKKQVALFWCERWDLNPHSVTNTPLKRARLPFRHARIKIFFIIHKKNLVVNKNYQNYHKQQIFNMMITTKGAKWR